MMKTTILLLISILLLSCGSRKKQLLNDEEKTSFDNQASKQENQSVTSEISSLTDIRNFLLRKGLKIKSTGQNYELKYGDLTFSGSADLEFTEKKEESIIHHIYKVHTTYITETQYQTKTYYKTNRTSKKVDIQRTGISFGSMIWIVSISLFVGAIISQLIRLYFKK